VERSVSACSRLTSIPIFS